MMNLSIKAPNTAVLLACLDRALKLFEESGEMKISLAKLSFADESAIEIYTEPEGIPFAAPTAPIAEKAKRSVRVRSWAKFWASHPNFELDVASLMRESGATRSACLTAISIATNNGTLIPRGEDRFTVKAAGSAVV